MVFQANNNEVHIGDTANFSKTISEYDIYSNIENLALRARLQFSGFTI